MNKYTTDEEVWKDIKGYEGLYQVSNHGQVRALERFLNTRTYPEKILSQRLDRYGYPRTTLWKQGKQTTYTIHKLVAEAFIPNSKGKPTINHKDGNKANNYVSNLERATWSENNQHALDTKLRVNKNNAQSIPVRQYSLDDEFIASYPSMAEAKRQTGIDHSNIGRACRINGTAGSYKWEYAN